MVSEKFPGKIFISTPEGIFVLTGQGSDWKYEGQLSDLTGEVLSLVEDERGHLWVAGYLMISRFKFPHGFTLQPEVNILGSNEGFDAEAMQTVEAYRIGPQVLFGSFAGIYYFDETAGRLRTYNEFSGLFTDGSREAFELVEDKNGGIWLGSELSRGRITATGGKYFWDTVALSRMPQVSTWCLYVDEQNVLWAGTEDGLFRYDPAAGKKYDQPYHALIRGVTAAGKILFSGTYVNDHQQASLVQPPAMKVKIPINENDLTFDYAAVFFDGHERTDYSVQLEGKSPVWSAWSRESAKDFTNLAEGRYVFRVKAKNIYGTVSNEASFEFFILPPWYRTWWAYLLYLLAAAVVIRIIIGLNHSRLINDKKRLGKLVAARTREILR